MELIHFDAMPLIYGTVMFLGVWSMWAKLVSGRILTFLLEVAIFTLVFKLHGGTMNGGFAAMVCALLAGFFLPRTFSKRK